MMQPLLGIVGGYGPSSSASFYSKLVSHAQELNQDFGPTFIVDNVGIPMDQAALSIAGDKDATVVLIDLANIALKRLADCGVTHVAIPCNTLHAFPDVLRIPSGVTLLHIADVFLQHIAKMNIQSIGVLASGTTMKAGFYQDALRAVGIVSVAPPENLQQMLNEEISHYVSAGSISARCREVFDAIFTYFNDQNVEALGLCCTDISTMLQSIPYPPSIVTVDSMEVLAKCCAELSVQRAQ